MNDDGAVPSGEASRLGAGASGPDSAAHGATATAAAPRHPLVAGLLRSWRWALFAAGLGAAALVIRSAGAVMVATTLLDAGAWVPLIMLLEAVWMGMDILVVRALLGAGATRVPPSVYATSAVTAYPITILLPGGRASAEVARAIALSRHVGVARVAIVGSQVHASSLLGTALGSVVCASVLAAREGVSARLTVFVMVNAAVTGGLGGTILFASRLPGLWAWIGKRFARLPALDDPARDPTARTGAAVLASGLARLVQALQLAVVYRAVVGSFVPSMGFVVQGVALASSLVGDLVPQQAGVSEGAFTLFRGALELGDLPVKAVSIALLIRFSQLLLAGLCLALNLLWKHPAPAPPRAT